MTRNADEPSKAVFAVDPAREQMLHALTATERNMLLFAQSAGMLVASLAGAKAGPNPALAEPQARLDRRRQELLALPPEQLRAMYLKQLASERAQAQKTSEEKAAKLRAQAEKREAAKFYNKPGAMADFEHWAKAAYWTLDEAVALLLGREPSVLTVDAVKKELAGPPRLIVSQAEPPSPFIAQYVRVRNLAVRALEGARLDPRRVVEWAMQSGAVQPPSGLAERLAPIPALASPEPMASDAAPALSGQPAAPSEKSKGTETKWTGERLAELAAYRKKHGTKAAAERYGISEGRVRQLLPSKPIGHSVFTHRIK